MHLQQLKGLLRVEERTHAAVGPRVGRGGLVIVPPDLGGAGAGEARVDVDAARVAGEFEWVGAGAARVEARQIVDEGLW